MNDRKKLIIRDTFQLTFARYCSQAIGFFTSIGMRRFLGPYYTGIWSIFKIISDYSSYVSLGVSEGAGYQIPFLIGQDNRQKEERTKDTAFSFIFLTSLAASLILLVVVIFLRDKYPVEVIAGLFILSIYIILDRLCGYYMLLLRARNNFSALSKAIVFDAFIKLILVFLLVKNFKIYGLYFTLISISILNVFFIHALVRYKINLTLKLSGLSEIIRIGLPITVMGFLEGILTTIDMIMIAKMIGVIFVGYYSISIMAKSYISKLSSFGTVLYPHLIKDYGKRQDMEDIKKYVLIPPKVNAYILPVLLGVIFFVIPALVKLVLPKFIPGILATQILLIDMFFQSCFPQAVHFLIAIKKTVQIIAITILCIFMAIYGNYIMIKRGYGIYGVAWVTSVISFVHFLLLQAFALKNFLPPRKIFLFFLDIAFPFVYGLIALLLINKFIPAGNIYLAVFIKSSIFILAMLPLLIYINKETKVINHILNTLMKRK
jgi:O-antigen/teichoic acid export membrane protein